MSAKKEKPALKALQKIYDTIKDLLLRIKPKLHESPSATGPSLVDDLYQIASLAQSFTEQRPRSNKRWGDLADNLDREGVTLWNMSSVVRRSTEDNGATVVAALRVAAFRLIEAGLEHPPNIETILHVLQVSSKTGATLSELGNKGMAASVLECAAKYEESLRTVDDPQDMHQQSKACATVIYLSSRMEAAWREGNDGVARFMVQKIAENDFRRLAHLPSRDRELLASKILEIGQSMLKDRPQEAKAMLDSPRAHEAVQWIQKAFVITEQLEDSATSGVAELKRSILRSLARAYFFSASHDPENLARAEATLQELIASIDASVDHASPEFQELRWMRIAVLKRRNAGDSVILDAFKSLIDNMLFTETTVTDLLLELRSLSKSHTLLSAIHQYCLEQALRSDGGSGRPFVDRLLMSLIVHSSKDKDHGRAMKDLEIVFNLIFESEFELSNVSTVACLTLIWQYGNRHYHAKRWPEAAEWFLAGSHNVFTMMDSSGPSKCFRKAALCYIEQREYARASAIIRRCPTNEATTHYVIMLTAVNQGLEDEAVRALQDMVIAPDFERKMLLLAVQLSHQAEMKILLLSILEALRQSLKARESINTVVEAMTLIRCSLRIALGLLEEPAANRHALIKTLLEYFSAAETLVADASLINASPMIAKDISWLWRTAYNTAVLGCAEWEDAEDRVSELFDISRKLMEAYCQTTMLDVDPDTYLHIVNASFAAMSARVFALRRFAANTGHIEVGQIQAAVSDIDLCKTRIGRIKDRNIPWEEVDLIRIPSFLSSLHIFEVELLCQLKDWKKLLTTVEEVTRLDSSTLTTFEAIADMLWVEKECPVDVLFIALEAILHAALDQRSLAVEKFSRWLRAICTILLSRGNEVDRTTAIRYLEQAVTVLGDDHDHEASNDPSQIYPIDEREWLLSTSYNTGLECLHASLLDESKRWFEVSTIICRFVPDGQQRAEKVSETYTHLLARYSRTT